MCGEHLWAHARQKRCSLPFGHRGFHFKASAPSSQRAMGWSRRCGRAIGPTTARSLRQTFGALSPLNALPRSGPSQCRRRAKNRRKDRAAERTPAPYPLLLERRPRSGRHERPQRQKRLLGDRPSRKCPSTSLVVSARATPRLPSVSVSQCETSRHTSGLSPPHPAPFLGRW